MALKFFHIYQIIKTLQTKKTLKVWSFGDFPGGPVVKILCFQSREHGFNPWSKSHMPCGTALPSPNKSDHILFKL